MPFVHSAAMADPELARNRATPAAIAIRIGQTPEFTESYSQARQATQ
jgi:hypothetical protein